MDQGTWIVESVGLCALTEEWLFKKVDFRITLYYYLKDMKLEIED